MKVVAVSSQGKKSTNNEDAYFLSAARGVFLLADGVGGGPGGRDASRLVVDTCCDLLTKGAPSIPLIEKFISETNYRVAVLAKETGQKGMASTLVLAWINNDSLAIFHVGDSRAYILRSGKLTQITEDHSAVFQRVGKADKEMVTRAVGVKDVVQADYGMQDWLVDDVLLLVSDGVSDPLSDLEIQEVLVNKRLSLTEKAGTLVKLAVEKGGQDDKTIVLVYNNK